MKKKFYWVNFKDESQIRLRESEGENLQKGLITGIQWFTVNDRAYSTSLIASVLPDEMDEEYIEKLIPRP